ncbi:MAG: CTAG/PCC1 family protein [Planctomycetes bacterium]|nr:CTAG/PCC1 family protein [Planctomycetota bacterium]
MSQKTSRQGKNKSRLCLNLEFPTKAEAAIVRKAVLPELNAGHSRRSATSIGIKNRIISIDIRAQDPIAMRAAFNSCLNSVILAKKVMEE